MRSATVEVNDYLGVYSLVLTDYTTLKHCWLVTVEGDHVLGVERQHAVQGSHSSGMFSWFQNSGAVVRSGFFSLARHDEVPAAPGYSKNLRVLINDRVFGDGLFCPIMSLEKSMLSSSFNLVASDGWKVRVSYRTPFFREILRRMDVGGTLEYQPVDYFQGLVEFVSCNRPQWIRQPVIS